MPSPSTSHRWPLTYRLGLVVVFLISMVVSARQVVFYWSRGPVSTDLRIFMTGVEMLRSGQGHQLYHFDAQQAVQNRLYPATQYAGLLPFNHLAYELLLYWPLAGLPYRTALIGCALFNMGLVFLIAQLVTPQVRVLRETAGVPIVLWLLAFYPVLYVFGEGQDSLLSLLLIVLSLRYALAQRRFLAGFILALALFKFHLALLIAFFVFVLPRNWRALAGLGTGTALVVTISRMMVGPTFAHDYLSMLRNQDVMTPWGFIPWFMPNLRGLLQWCLAPKLDIGEILPIILLVSIVVAGIASWLILRSRVQEQETALFIVGVLTTLLVSFHLHMQDLALAVLPMLLLLESSLSGKVSRGWTCVLIVATASLYLYRLAAEPFQILLVRGCLLAIPVLMLWMVANRGVLARRQEGA